MKRARLYDDRLLGEKKTYTPIFHRTLDAVDLLRCARMLQGCGLHHQLGRAGQLEPGRVALLLMMKNKKPRSGWQLLDERPVGARQRLLLICHDSDGNKDGQQQEKRRLSWPPYSVCVLYTAMGAYLIRQPSSIGWMMDEPERKWRRRQTSEKDMRVTFQKRKG